MQYAERSLNFCGCQIKNAKLHCPPKHPPSTNLPSLPPLWLPCAVGGYLHSVIFATLGSINVNMELLSLFIQVDRRVHDTRVRGGGGGLK